MDFIVAYPQILYVGCWILGSSDHWDLSHGGLPLLQGEEGAMLLGCLNRYEDYEGITKGDVDPSPLKIS